VTLRSLREDVIKLEPAGQAGCSQDHDSSLAVSCECSYYHVNEAIAYLETLGYRGARRLFRRPLEVNARGTRDDNSW
jgi:hypothetical protein